MDKAKNNFIAKKVLADEAGMSVDEPMDKIVKKVAFGRKEKSDFEYDEALIPKNEEEIW